MAGQRSKEVAENINTYEGFQKTSRDQRSVREHFHKLLADFREKMRKENRQVEYLRKHLQRQRKSWSKLLKLWLTNRT